MPASRSRFAVIFFTVLIDLIGFGIVMPILPFYAKHFGAGGLAYGAVLGVYSFMQFVATALLGKLSDLSEDAMQRLSDVPGGERLV